MNYWSEMQSKWGFGDGDAVPAGIEHYRTAYILAVSALEPSGDGQAHQSQTREIPGHGRNSPQGGGCGMTNYDAYKLQAPDYQDAPEPQHSPAPWLQTGRDSDGVISITSEGKVIAILEPSDVDGLNADLISAAPALLKGCKMFVKMLESGQLVRSVSDDGSSDYMVLMMEFVSGLQAAVSAITKAEGR